MVLALDLLSPSSNTSSAEPSGQPTTMGLKILASLAFAALAFGSPVESLEKRSIACLNVGATSTATWKNSAGKTCRWTGIVGSNFGTNSVNGGECVSRKTS